MVERITGTEGDVAARSAAVGVILQSALSKGRVKEVLDSPVSVLEKSLLGLLSFHERYLSDGMRPENLAADLHDIYEALMSSLSRTFLDEMHKNAAKYYLTAGSEGEIYRLKTATGDFIIAKRRYDSVGGRN